MTTQTFGQRIKRNEDPQLLTGRAQFVDDVDLPGMLEVAFKRSEHAHARIVSIDVTKARTMPGVVAVYTAEDLGDFWQPAPLVIPPPPITNLVFNQRTGAQLAKGKVRHVGEPIVMVVAENRYRAEDSIETIIVEYEPLDVVLDLEAALSETSTLVHEDLGTNLAAHAIQQKGNYEMARAQAEVVVNRRFDYERGSGASLEGRGIVAQYDPLARHLTVWDSTQAPVPIRNGLARLLDLSERQVQVIAPFVGGGFGPKMMMFYPEEVLIPWAARQLQRPLKWIEDRLEHFYATAHDRLQVHEAEIALTKDGKILGLKDTFLHDTGAYDPYGLVVPINTQCTMPGCYVIPDYYTEFKVVFTNRTITAAYRGAGRPNGIFVVERLLDLAAKELAMDPTELRRRNFIQPDQFPWGNEIMHQDFTQLTYDSGNYGAVLNKAKRMIGWEAFQRPDGEPARLRAEGKKVGIGLVMYVEGTGIGPYEGARVQVEASGKVTLVTAVGTQGQGHYTAFAQLVADALSVPVQDVYVSTGDTDQFNWGIGTFASRGAVVAGSAVHSAAQSVRQKAIKLAAEQLEAREEDIELIDGVARVRGVPEAQLGLATLAMMANPLRGTVPPGTEPGLEATAYFYPEMGATASGAHAMIVEVDPETFNLKILKYVAVHDSGTLINPLLVEGQVHGGVAQGIGNAFYEQLAFDENGQLRNASFMDYLLPTATDVPRMDLGHEETPSPLNPLGFKGAGEAGCIPVAALFAQALENALAETGLEILEMPLSPNRLWELAMRQHS
jgi:aerobic carbon-monoxide dehydrogenase large subunit